MLEHAEELAILVTSEQGKPLAQARQEISYGAGFVDWFAAEGERAYGETIDPDLKVGARISKAARDRGLIARAMPHGDILGFAPPLVVSEAEIDEIVDLAYRATKDVLDELAKEPAVGT